MATTGSAIIGASSYSETPAPKHGKAKAEVVPIDSRGSTYMRTSGVIADLYVAEHSRPELGRASTLLEKSVALSQRAIGFLDDEDSISADDLVQRIQPVLRELFCCRSLGDGFGIVVNALIWGIENRHGAIVERRHIAAIAKALSVIHSEPFLSSDDAVDITFHLEEAGFDIEPAAFDKFTELMDG